MKYLAITSSGISSEFLILQRSNVIMAPRIRWPLKLIPVHPQYIIHEKERLMLFMGTTRQARLPPFLCDILVFVVFLFFYYGSGVVGT